MAKITKSFWDDYIKGDNYKSIGSTGGGGKAPTYGQNYTTVRDNPNYKFRDDFPKPSNSYSGNSGKVDRIDTGMSGKQEPKSNGFFSMYKSNLENKKKAELEKRSRFNERLSDPESRVSKLHSSSFIKDFLKPVTDGFINAQADVIGKPTALLMGDKEGIDNLNKYKQKSTQGLNTMGKVSNFTGNMAGNMMYAPLLEKAPIVGKGLSKLGSLTKSGLANTALKEGAENALYSGLVNAPDMLTGNMSKGDYVKNIGLEGAGGAVFGSALKGAGDILSKSINSKVTQYDPIFDKFNGNINSKVKPISQGPSPITDESRLLYPPGLNAPNPQVDLPAPYQSNLKRFNGTATRNIPEAKMDIPMDTPIDMPMDIQSSQRINKWNGNIVNPKSDYIPPKVVDYKETNVPDEVPFVRMKKQSMNERPIETGYKNIEHEVTNQGSEVPYVKMKREQRVPSVAAENRNMDMFKSTNKNIKSLIEDYPALKPYILDEISKLQNSNTSLGVDIKPDMKSANWNELDGIISRTKSKIEEGKNIGLTGKRLEQYILDQWRKPGDEAFSNFITKEAARKRAILDTPPSNFELEDPEAMQRYMNAYDEAANWVDENKAKYPNLFDEDGFVNQGNEYNPYLNKSAMDVIERAKNNDYRQWTSTEKGYKGNPTTSKVNEEIPYARVKMDKKKPGGLVEVDKGTKTVAKTKHDPRYVYSTEGLIDKQIPSFQRFSNRPGSTAILPDGNKGVITALRHEDGKNLAHIKLENGTVVKRVLGDYRIDVAAHQQDVQPRTKHTYRPDPNKDLALKGKTPIANQDPVKDMPKPYKEREYKKKEVANSEIAMSDLIGDKDSRFYKETSPESNSKDLNKELDNRKYLGSYDSITNKDTHEAAMRGLSGDLDRDFSDINDYFKKNKYVDPVNMTKAQIIVKQLDSAKRYDSAAELIDRISQNATSLGQSIQTLAMYSKLSPEGALRVVAKEFDKVGTKITPEATQKVMDTMKDIQKITDDNAEAVINRTNVKKGEKQKTLNELVEEFKANVGSNNTGKTVGNIQKEVKKSATADEAKAIEYARMLRDLKQMYPKEFKKSFGDKWTAWNMLSMLGNPKTLLRNVLGNTSFGVADTLSEQTFGRVVDKALSLKTKENTISGYNVKNVKNAIKDGTTEAKKVYNYIKEGIDPQKLDIQNQGGTFKNPILKGWEKATNVGLNVPDVYAYEYAKNMSLDNQMRAANTNKPTDKMLEIAEKEALEKTFKDKNGLSDSVTGFQRTLDKASGNARLGSKIIPFAKTPANVLKRAIEYSPAGIVEGGIKAGKLLKGNKDINQRDVSRILGRGLSGTITGGAAGYAASKAGLLQGDLASGGDDKKLRSSVGERSNTLQVGNKNIDISQLAPGISPVLVGANIQQNIANGMSPTEAITKAYWDGTVGSVKESPFAQGMKNAVDLINGDTTIGEYAGNLLGQSIPTLSNQAARTFDKTTADTYNAENPTVAKLMNKIPGLANKVPDWIDPLSGEAKKNSSFDSLPARALDQFLNPFIVTKDNEKGQELYKAAKEGGNLGMFPKSLNPSISATKGKDSTIKYDPKTGKRTGSQGSPAYKATKLKGEDYQKYSEMYGKRVKQLVDQYGTNYEAINKDLTEYMKMLREQIRKDMNLQQ